MFNYLLKYPIILYLKTCLNVRLFFTWKLVNVSVYSLPENLFKCPTILYLKTCLNIRLCFTNLFKCSIICLNIRLFFTWKLVESLSVYPDYNPGVGEQFILLLHSTHIFKLTLSHLHNQSINQTLNHSIIQPITELFIRQSISQLINQSTVN